MDNSYIFCIALSRGRAGRLVLNLREAGFSNAEISALFLVQTAGSGQGVAAGAEDGSQVQAATVIYGVMAWLAAGGFLIIPGHAPIVAAGPIVSALGEDADESVVDGLTALGVPSDKAWRYEKRVRSGEILVSVKTERSDLGTRAMALFASAGAEDICTTRDLSLLGAQTATASGLLRTSP